MYVDLLRKKAPRIEGGEWVGGPAPSLEGRPVFIDFWDYARVSCLLGLPYVFEWHKRYAGMGMVFMAVQTPSFQFGRDPENVKKAHRHLGLPYPVLVDVDGEIGKAFGIQDLPCKYVMDKDGFLRFYQVGKGDQEDIELFLQQALREMDSSLKLPDILPPLRSEDRVGGFTLPHTHDVRFADGIGNPEEVQPGEVVRYAYPSSMEDGVAYLEGEWLKEVEAQTLSGSGSFRIVCRTAEVFLVASHPEGGELRVTLSGNPVPPEVRGDDFRASKAESALNVTRARPYQIIRSEEVGDFDLKVSCDLPGLSIYSLQFLSRMPRHPS